MITISAKLLRFSLAGALGIAFATANAEPRFSDELATHVPRVEIQKLAEVAGHRFGLEVTAIEYAFLDAPPAGDPAAVVLFKDQATSENVSVSPSALYYYLPWFTDEPLDASKRKVTNGRWATTGDLDRTTKYRCVLPSGTYLIAFDKVPYDVAMDLLQAIERDDYDVLLGQYSNLPSRTIEQSAHSEFGGLHVEHVRSMYSRRITEPDTDRKIEAVALDVAKPNERPAHWVFVKVGAKWRLVEAMNYVI